MNSIAVGIDVSKHSCVVSIDKGKPSPLANTQARCLELAERLPIGAIIHLEATGGYERWVRHTLAIGDWQSDIADMPSDIGDWPSDIADMPSDIVDMPSDIVDMPSYIADMPSYIANMPSDIADMPSCIVDMPSEISD